MYADGAPTKECAQRFHVNPWTVHRWVREAGVSIRPMAMAKRIYTCDEHVFKRSDIESQYWLGFLLADGCIRFRGERKSNATLSLALNEQDLYHLETFKCFMKSTHPISYSTRYKTYRIDITSDTLGHDLYLKGCIPKKSLTLEYPASGYIHSRHFIRGYFDGDGSISVYEKRYCQATVKFVGTYNFLEKLQAVLVAEADIHANVIHSHAHSAAKYLSYAGRGNVKKLYNYFYAEGGPCLERKKAKFEYVLSYHERKAM